MPYRTAGKAARYGAYVLHELRWPLLVILLLIFGGGTLFSLTLRLPYGKACFGVFMLMLGEPTLDFPDVWYDQLLFFAIPIIGIGAVADSVVRLGYLIFTSKRKLQEWWIMEASSYRKHVVVAGLGRVGYRIVRELLSLREPVVVIERNRESPFVDELADSDVPILYGEVRLKKTLENANVPAARAIILATDDDLANLDGALTAREMNPEIRVVMRLFDDTLAGKVATTFKMPAISTSQVSAPAFVAAATGRAVLHSFQIDGQTMHVADFSVDRLAARTVSALQKEFDVSVILHKSAQGSGLTPNPESAVQAGDTIVVVAPVDRIRKLEAANRG
jgi:voltage-gated potassium channel